MKVTQRLSGDESTLRTVLAMIVISMLSSVAFAAAQKPARGVVVVTADSGETVALYENSHALLVGASRYHEWPSLESIPGELEHVREALEEQGFSVETVLDPTAQELRSAFESFVQRYGYAKNNRLVFFFSGHGYTRSPAGYENKGYIVPIDAPLPARDATDFLAKALPMTQLMEWSRRLEAKHALFLFDSCFSGSIFQTRSPPADTPPHISDATSRPVVQFITAGGANDEVPANSVFAPAFVDALRDSKGDLNSDGYVTGVELGLYLRQTVPQFASQHPQFGRHRDYQRAQGDFVFFVGDVDGQTPARSLAPDPARPGQADRSNELTQRINLISPENGGGLMFVSNDNWLRVIEPEEHYTADLYIDDWAVFFFSDERRARFDTFRVRVNGSSSTNLQEFELLASDDSPDGEFRSLGRFKVPNYKSMRDPFHSIALPLTSARYIKMRIVSSHGHGLTWNHEFQLLGALDTD